MKPAFCNFSFATLPTERDGPGAHRAVGNIRQAWPLGTRRWGGQNAPLANWEIDEE
jgi:hypothetical protein